jgi:hypothetical protein
VRSDPDAARFVASQVPDDDPTAELLAALHEGR